MENENGRRGVDPTNNINKYPYAANPQAEDGHTDIANELAEAFQRVNLSPYEWRVLWAILRESYGWHRKMAPISLTDFQKMTGVDRSNISRTLSKLVRRRIIRKGIENKKKFRRYSGDSDNTNAVTYGLQKDYLKWRDSGYSDNPLSIQTTKMVAIQTTDVDRKPLNTKGHRTPKESKETKHYVADSNEWRLSTLLLNEILKNKANLKKPNLQAWAKEIDLMIWRDGRKPERIREVILWCQHHYFWWKNVLSTEKLRKQFDRLEIEMEDKKKDPSKTEMRVQYQDLTGRGTA